MRNHTNRRRFLTASAVLLSARHSFAASTPPKSVAAVVTVYRPNSHADVIVSKILSGWKHDGGAGPNLRLASLYVDQIPDDDMSQGLSAKHKFPIYDTIERAITLGTNRVAVDGILCIGEHGDYPWNEGSANLEVTTLYPRPPHSRPSQTFHS